MKQVADAASVERQLQQHVIDRHGVVWLLVHDGGMATRAHEAGIVSIGINTLRHENGPLVSVWGRLEQAWNEGWRAQRNPYKTEADQ